MEDKAKIKTISREEILDRHYLRLTVKDLKEFIQKHDLPDDAVVMIQRVEDAYYEKHNWRVLLKEGDVYHNAVEIEEGKKSGKFNDKKKYPKITEEFLNSRLSPEFLDFLKEQYTPASTCVKYLDEDNLLFINLHY